jgi:hypothetical protein
MKYVCLGYMDETRWQDLSEAERHRMMDECFVYDDEMRDGGHFKSGEALQSTRNATTLRQQAGHVAITDGPFAETKEQLGGIIILEATDLNHAIQIMSKHPSLKFGSTWEIRPAADLHELLMESGIRRAVSVER